MPERNIERQKSGGRMLYACQVCGEEFGAGEENNGRCPHCGKGVGEPIGECEDGDDV